MRGPAEKVSQRAPTLIAHTKKALAGHGFGRTRTARWTRHLRSRIHTKIAAVQAEPTELLKRAKFIRMRHSARLLVCVLRALPRRKLVSFRLRWATAVTTSHIDCTGPFDISAGPRVSQRRGTRHSQPCLQTNGISVRLPSSDDGKDERALAKQRPNLQ